MADGTISLAEGLGIKALDSNELRRKQKNLVGSIPISQTDKPNNSIPFEFGTPQMSNSGDYKNGSTFQSSSPTKKPSPSWKLQQVLFEESLRLEAEERAHQVQLQEVHGGVRDLRFTHLQSKQSDNSDSSIPIELGNPRSNYTAEVNRASSSTGLGTQLEAEECAHQVHIQQQQQEVLSNPNPKTLVNARGISYLEGDPNMGYPEEDTKPRWPWSSKNGPNQTAYTHPRQNPNGPKPKPKNWAALLQSQSPSFEMKLEFHPESFKGKEAQVEIDIELTDVGIWNKYLVGHFLDGKMPYPLVLSTARYQWKELFVAVKPDVAGCYLFEFRDEQAKQQVLDGGPYFFSQKYLVLKDWHRMMKPVKEQPSHIPAWVRLRNLPLELWNQECLSRVASTIGKPLHVDQATTKTSRQPGLLQTKSTNARICIEISAEYELPDDVRISVEGESVVVPIEYQVLPSMCKQCQVFGHSTAQCSKKSTSTPSQPNQDWTIVGNGTHRNHPTQLHPCATSSTSPSTTPAVVIDDSEDELEKVLESIVSSSQETLNLPRIEVPIPQLEEAVNIQKEPDLLSQQKLPVPIVHNGTLEEEDGNIKVTTSLSEQNAAVGPIFAAPVSRSATKKAATIAAKLKDKEPPDSSAILDFKLMLGGSNKSRK
ncbi:hypothetical protein RHGRI_020861 [Rhododendron griersonianum]|uniref:DUF4283 domain-containing protein n=1 Tax=Rhododendron griersonianum TaxID=479676 RepID=A0AAV6JHX6_9ERIC|nr:hypothetical protein RHGRI_020861 [Rhododendron griersonianum]